MAKRVKSAVDVLREAIEGSRLTAYAIAKQSGIGVDSLYRFCKGERDLRFETAAKIMAVVNLELKPKSK